MNIKALIENLFDQTFIEYCLYDEALSGAEINDKKHYCLSIYDVDRDGVSEMVNEHVSLINSYFYWLDDSEDGTAYLQEILVADNIVIHGDISMGAFCDEGQDASGLIHFYQTDSDSELSETIAKCKQSIHTSLSDTLSSPMRRHRHLLGEGKTLGKELSNIICSLVKGPSLDQSILAMDELHRSIETMRKELALQCFSSLFPNETNPSFTYKADTDELIMTETGEIHSPKQLVASVKQYLLAASLLGTRLTSVSGETLSQAHEILRG